MERKHLLRQVLSLALLVLLLSSCSGAKTTPTPELTVPAGTVKGTLVDNNSQPVSNYILKLLKVTGKEGDQLVLKALDDEVKTDEKGDFAFTNVESGKYVVVVLTYSPASGQEPTFNLAEQVLRDNDNKVLILELPQSEGIDLGILLWNK